MSQLCRHILPAGRHCTQPAVRPTLYCRHHQVIKRALAKVEPKPDPYGLYTPLPFVFPEDRAALQINFMLVAQALNDRSMHIQMANTFNRIFRSCQMNLKQGPLTETAPEKPQKQARRNPNEKWLTDDDDSEPQRNPHGEMVRTVVLTPEGEEIAPPREVWEENEVETHGKDCPCQNCAENYRGAPPEQHHPQCQCGICEKTTEPQPPISDQDKIELSSQPKQSEVEGPAAELSSRPKQSEVEGPAVPHPSHEAPVTELSSRPEELDESAAVERRDISTDAPCLSWGEEQDKSWPPCGNSSQSPASF